MARSASPARTGSASTRVFAAVSPRSASTSSSGRPALLAQVRRRRRRAAGARLEHGEASRARLEGGGLSAVAGVPDDVRTGRAGPRGGVVRGPVVDDDHGGHPRERRRVPRRSPRSGRPRPSQGRSHRPESPRRTGFRRSRGRPSRSRPSARSCPRPSAQGELAADDAGAGPALVGGQGRGARREPPRAARRRRRPAASSSSASVSAGRSQTGTSRPSARKAPT